MAALAGAGFLAELVAGDGTEPCAEQRAAEAAARNRRGGADARGADNSAFLLRLLALDEAGAEGGAVARRGAGDAGRRSFLLSVVAAMASCAPSDRISTAAARCLDFICSSLLSFRPPTMRAIVAPGHCSAMNGADFPIRPAASADLRR